jgi:hypothetical protein
LGFVLAKGKGVVTCDSSDKEFNDFNVDIYSEGAVRTLIEYSQDHPSVLVGPVHTYEQQITNILV